MCPFTLFCDACDNAFADVCKVCVCVCVCVCVHVCVFLCVLNFLPHPSALFSTELGSNVCYNIHLSPSVLLRFRCRCQPSCHPSSSALKHCMEMLWPKVRACVNVFVGGRWGEGVCVCVCVCE